MPGVMQQEHKEITVLKRLGPPLLFGHSSPLALILKELGTPSAGKSLGKTCSRANSYSLKYFVELPLLSKTQHLSMLEQTDGLGGDRRWAKFQRQVLPVQFINLQKYCWHLQRKHYALHLTLPWWTLECEMYNFQTVRKPSVLGFCEA